MQELNYFKIFTDKFNLLNIDYAVTGSVASIIYGEPRVTHDIDFVLIVSEFKVDEIIAAFPISEFYFPPKEIILNEIKKETRGHCNIIHNLSGFKADLYFAGNEEIQYWAIENVKEIDFLGSKIKIAPVEYVIIKKLEFYKEGKAQKHLLDVKSILTNSNDLINFKFLNKQLKKNHLMKEWLLVKE